MSAKLSLIYKTPPTINQLTPYPQFIHLMHRKGNNYEQYTIQKKRFDEQQQSEYGQINNPRDKRQGRNADIQRREPKRSFKQGKGDDIFAVDLRKLPQYGGMSKTMNKAKFSKKMDMERFNKTTPIVNLAKVNQPQRAELKQKLDKQMEDYKKQASGNASVVDKSRQGSQISKEDQNDPDWSEDLSIPMISHEERTPNVVKRGTNHENKKIQVEASPDEDSNWLSNAQDESNTSSINIQKILNESDFPSPDAVDKSKENKILDQKKINIKRDPSTGVNKGKIEANELSDAKILNSFSLYGTQGQDSLNDGHLTTSENFPSHLLSEEVFENECHIVEAKKEEEPRISEEQLKDQMQLLQKDGWLKVSLTFEVYDNILQLKIKEVELVRLKVVVKVSGNNGKISLLKYPDTSHQQIQKCISFISTGHFFPRMLSHLPEDIPNAVEGDQQFDSVKQSSKIDLQFCKVRGTEPEQEKGKIDKSVIMLRSVQVSCMECMTVNKIVVVQSNNAVMGSCRSCSTKIEGRITALRLTSE